MATARSAQLTPAACFSPARADSAAPLQAGTPPAPAPAPAPAPDRWGSRPLFVSSGGGAAPAASANGGHGNDGGLSRPAATASGGGGGPPAQPPRGVLTVGGGFGGADGDSGGLDFGLGGQPAGEDEFPDNCGFECVGSASGDGEATPAGAGAGRGAVRVALSADGRLSDADYDAIRRAYVVRAACPGGNSPERVVALAWEFP